MSIDIPGFFREIEIPLNRPPDPAALKNAPQLLELGTNRPRRLGTSVEISNHRRG